jgi:hypothetical protein
VTAPAHGTRFELDRVPDGYEGRIVAAGVAIAVRLRVSGDGAVTLEATAPLDPEQERLAKAFVRTAVRSGELPRRIVRWRAL